MTDPPPEPSPAPVTRAGDQQAWPRLPLLSMGMLSGPAFLYAGIKAQHRLWLAFAALYTALTAAAFVLVGTSPDDSSQETIAGGLLILLWGVSSVHAFALRDEYARRTRLLGDPALEAGEERLLRREKARRLVASDPHRARELGVGRPDVEGSFDGGLVDLNNASAHAIAELPGFDPELARRAVEGRAAVSGFTSVDDLDLVLDLPVETLEAIRERVVFLPRPGG